MSCDIQAARHNHQPINQPTGHKMSRQGLHVPKNAYFRAKMSRFWANHPNYFGREQKLWNPHIRKPPRHNVSIIFFGRAWHHMNQNGQYLAQNDQKYIFLVKFGTFSTKNHNFHKRKQKFWYPHIGKPPRHLVGIIFLPGLDQMGQKG